MVIWGRFLLQTRLAMHERSNLECMGFYPRPSCTAVRTRSQFPCVAWRFLRTNLKLVLHTVWTLGDLWRSKVVPENVPPSFTHYSNSEKKTKTKCIGSIQENFLNVTCTFPENLEVMHTCISYLLSIFWTFSVVLLTPSFSPTSPLWPRPM